MYIYLDNAATSFPKPETVHDAVSYAMRHIGVAPGRGGHRLGLAANRLVFEARESVAALFSIGDSSRIVFTHSATEALNIALLGLLRPGDHVVTTSMEHNSLARPLHLASCRGVQVSWVEADSHGRVNPCHLAAAMRDTTKLVAMAHCSNVSGTIQPIEEISRIVRASSAFFLVDAAQSAGSIPVDAPALGIDMLAVPGHKGLLGPQGTGVLYVSERVDLEPFMVGGTGGRSSALEQPAAMPERLESGTLNTPGIAGLKAGVDFVMREGVAAIRDRESELVSRLVEGLNRAGRVTVYGPPVGVERGSVVSFTVSGMDPQEVGYRLDQDFGIAVRVGLHCAPSAHRTLGTWPAGTVRVSPGYFNTVDEIELFLKAMRTIVA